MNASPIPITILTGFLGVGKTNLLERPLPPEYVIIETSGVNDPWAVADTFLLPELRALFRLDGVITVVDAEYVDQQPTYESLIIDQISAADIVVLNKIDLISPERHRSVAEWIRRIIPQARILPTSYGDVPLDLLFDNERSAATIRLHPAEGVTENTHERGKGVVYLAEVPQRKAILQLVGVRVHVTVGEPWGDEMPQTQMAFIGLPGGVDEVLLHAAFDRCLAADQTVSGEMAEQQSWSRPSAS